MSDDFLSTPAILERIQSERDSLIARVHAIPVEFLDTRPDSTHWSVAEVLEHLVRVETGLTKLFALRGQAAPPDDTPTPDPSSFYRPAEASLVRDRTQRIEAPERSLPSGSIKSDDALTHLAASRAGLLSAFSSANLDALDRITHPHPIFGPLTLRSWMALLADHDARHSEQIGEIADRLRVVSENP